MRRSGRRTIMLLSIGLPVAGVAWAAWAGDGRAPTGGMPDGAAPAGRPAVVLPQAGAASAPSAYLPDDQDGRGTGPSIAQPTGGSIPGRPPSDPTGPGPQTPSGPRPPPPVAPGLPDGAGLGGSTMGVGPDELIEQLKELARRPDLLSRTPGPAMLEDAARPPFGSASDDDAPGQGDRQP